MSSPHTPEPDNAGLIQLAERCADALFDGRATPKAIEQAAGGLLALVDELKAAAAPEPLTDERAPEPSMSMYASRGDYLVARTAWAVQRPAIEDRAGVFGKYVLRKTSGKPLDPDACYFVLRLDTDEAARYAAMEYARRCDDRQLAHDLTACVVELNAPCSCRSVGDHCARHPQPFSAVWRAGEAPPSIAASGNDATAPSDEKNEVGAALLSREVK